MKKRELSKQEKMTFSFKLHSLTPIVKKTTVSKPSLKSQEIEQQSFKFVNSSYSSIQKLNFKNDASNPENLMNSFRYNYPNHTSYIPLNTKQPMYPNNPVYDLTYLDYILNNNAC